MSDMIGAIGDLRFTIEITRKETGKTETFELVGFLDETKLKEFQDGSDTQHSSP